MKSWAVPASRLASGLRQGIFKRLIGMKRILSGMAMVMLMLASPLTVIAQTSTSGIPASEVNLKVGECDPSLNLLNAILSGGGGQTFDGDFEGEGIGCRAGSWVWQGDMPFGAVAKVFLYANTLAMIFAGGVLIYIMVVGTMRSAEDGEVLGRGWSTLWVPLRATIGFAALVPTSSGFSWVQIGVIWMATQGIGGGNYLWSNTVKEMFDNPGELVAIRAADNAQVMNVMRAILKAETCIRYLNNQAQAAGEADPATGAGPYSRFMKRDSKGGVIFRWGHTTMGFFKTSECGVIEIESKDLIRNPVFEIDGNLLRAQTIVMTAQTQAITAAADRMSTLADELAAPHDPTRETSTEDEDALQARIAQAVYSAANKYRLDIAKSAGEESGALSSFDSGKSLSQITGVMTKGIIEDAERNGWIGAGAFYFTMANVNTAINEITTSVPEITPPEISESNETFTLPAYINERIDRAFNPATMKAIEWSPGDSELDDIVGDSVSSLKSSGNRWFYETISVDPTNDKHAIVQLKNVGDALVGSAEAILFATAISKIPGVDSLVTAAKATLPGGAMIGVMGKLNDMVNGKGDEDKTGVKAAYIFGMLFLMAILVGAIMLAYWIPFAPFVIWIGGIFGWVVSILEMLGASILWAVAHLHPEGEGMASKYGANGYMIIIEVVLRPALMILGFILAFAATDPFLRFTSALFFKAMSVANQDNFSALIGFLCYVAIYVGLCLSIVHKSHALIHMIPNSIFKWIGAHANSYDDGRTAEAIQQNVSGYLMKVGSVGSQAAPGAA